jgi:predicted transcriptional regulator
MSETPQPTPRELQILKVLWERGEATVHDVYEALRDELGIVQNTVQAFLRTMEGKGLVRHRTEGRTFIYRPVRDRERTGRTVVATVLDRLFDGAVDQLVANALSVKPPSAEELDKLRAMLEELEKDARRGRKGGRS